MRGTLSVGSYNISSISPSSSSLGPIWPMAGRARSGSLGPYTLKVGTSKSGLEPLSLSLEVRVKCKHLLHLNIYHHHSRQGLNGKEMRKKPKTLRNHEKSTKNMNKCKRTPKTEKIKRI